VVAAVEADVRRGREKDPPTEAVVIFADMLQRLEIDPLWAREYEDFVAAVSFGGPHESISFDAALVAVRRLAARC
jgi:hypothetical protein